VRRFTDPDEFWVVAGPVLRAEPVLHSVLASVVEAVRRAPGLHAVHDFYAVARPGRPPFLALHTPPFPLHLPVADGAAAARLAEAVRDSGTAPAGVSGDPTSATAFADRWCALTGERWRVSVRLGLYDLPVAPRLPRAVPGKPRLARRGDLPLVDRWLAAFAAEIGGPAPGAGQAAAAVAEGRVWLWCDPEPVAMALTSVPVGGVTRISYVYTPAASRGRGYASGVTAAASSARQADGLRCLLYTDLANPTSNGIYAALGYRRLGEAVEIELRS
jgi:hypothetical protein